MKPDGLRRITGSNAKGEEVLYGCMFAPRRVGQGEMVETFLHSAPESGVLWRSVSTISGSEITAVIRTHCRRVRGLDAEDEGPGVGKPGSLVTYGSTIQFPTVDCEPDTKRLMFAAAHLAEFVTTHSPGLTA